MLLAAAKKASDTTQLRLVKKAMDLQAKKDAAIEKGDYDAADELDKNLVTALQALGIGAPPAVAPVRG